MLRKDKTEGFTKYLNIYKLNLIQLRVEVLTCRAFLGTVFVTLRPVTSSRMSLNCVGKNILNIHDPAYFAIYDIDNIKQNKCVRKLK